MGSGMRWLLKAITIIVTCTGVDTNLSVYKARGTWYRQSPMSETTSLGGMGGIWARECFETLLAMLQTGSSHSIP